MSEPTLHHPRSLTPVDFASLLFLGAVWGGAFLFLRIAAPEVGPVWAAEIRLAIGASVLLAFAGRRTFAAMRGRVIAFTIVGTTFAAIPFTCIAFASLTLPTGFTALLNAATPLFTAALGVAAVLVLVGWSHLDPTPATLMAVAAGLGAPASYAVAGTYVRARLDDVPGVELATGMLLMGALVTLPVAVVTGAPGTPTMAGIASLVAVGVVSTALAWPVFYRVLARSTPTVASTVTFIVPVFATLWGSLVLGEAVGAELVVA